MRFTRCCPTENNPYETSSYATFTAEIASTTNEVLLQEHMLAQDISDDERLFYLGTALEAARGTFFRQVMFAEFELKIHEMVESGEALSGEKMTRVYESLLRQYHGADDGVLAIDPAYAVEWAFIPHFYRNFYVFQYATSIAGGTDVRRAFPHWRRAGAGRLPGGTFGRWVALPVRATPGVRHRPCH